MRLLSACLFLSLTLGATLVAAQEAPPEVPAARRGRPGTHFIAEPFAGMHVQGAGNFAWGGFLGYGGKPPGTPLIFYAVAGFMRSGDSRLTSVQGSNDRNSLDLRMTDVDAGLRVYVPLIGPLRLTTEVMLGATLADASLRNPTVGLTQQNHADPHIMLGAGPQLRILHELSVGVLARTILADTGEIKSDGALSAWKSDLGRRTVIAGTLSFHW